METLSKHDSLHLKAESLHFQMEQTLAPYLEYFAKISPFKVQKVFFYTTNYECSCPVAVIS